MSRLRIVHCAALLAALLLLPGIVADVTGRPASPAVRPRNLLRNPGFEQGLEGHAWMPAGWDTSQSGLPTVFFGRDTFMVHSGKYAVNIANLSTVYPMSHNWSQTLLADRSWWGKDLVFSVWTRSNGLQGRAYVLLQAYRDTVSKMARVWGIERDDAARRLRINKVDDPLIDFGWKRASFSEAETDWVRREVRVLVAPTTNVVFVRCGLQGTGQVIFDDASLTLEPARPAPPATPGENLLADPGFEGDGNAWEYALPPYEDTRVERDTTVARSGRASIRLSSGGSGPVQVRTGVCQAICNRNLAGKRVRLSGFIRTDSLQGLAYIKLYAHTLRGVDNGPVAQQFSHTMDWRETAIEMDVPRDTYLLWAWFLFNAPCEGVVHYDDVSLTVVPAEAKREPPARK